MKVLKLASVAGHTGYLQRERALKDVDCPTCGAPAGGRCITEPAAGFGEYSHVGRYDAAAELGLVPRGFCKCHRDVAWTG